MRRGSYRPIFFVKWICTWSYCTVWTIPGPITFVRKVVLFQVILCAENNMSDSINNRGLKFIQRKLADKLSWTWLEDFWQLHSHLLKSVGNWNCDAGCSSIHFCYAKNACAAISCFRHAAANQSISRSKSVRCMLYVKIQLNSCANFYSFDALKYIVPLISKITKLRH